MKRSSLTSAIVAGITGACGIASVSVADVTLNPDGLGQVLIYPYYTVNGGNQTLLSVVNTTNTGKAVKVRFLEGRNSREVLDFNLYLSEFDVWTAAIFADAASTTGAGRLITLDRTCTVPAIFEATNLPTINVNGTPRNYVPFRNFAYAGSDAGPDADSRTREGYVEMIEMGTIISDGDGLDPLFSLTHVGGVPRDCSDLVQAWTPGGYWFVNNTEDIVQPSGGLFGGGAIVNVADGSFYNYNADAIDGFRVASLHTNPGLTVPNLTQALTDVANNRAVSTVFDRGGLIRYTWPNTSTPVGAPTTVLSGTRQDAVTSVLAYDNLMNEYSVEAALGARSEWIVTFPTKRFYTDEVIVGAAAIPPFTDRFRITVGDPNGRACEGVVLSFYDREEQRPQGGVDFSPPIPGFAPSFCWEAQVVTFNQNTGFGLPTNPTPSAILGSTYSTNVDVGSFQFGWLNIDLARGSVDPLTGGGGQVVHISRPSLEGKRFLGLPVVGSWVLNVQNANAQPNRAGFYGGLYRHRGTRACSLIAGATAGSCITF